MAIEFEIKLALPLRLTNARIEQALGEIPGMSLTKWSDHLQENTYFDSEDGAIRKSRIALRHRRVDGRNVITVKTPLSDNGDRHEWEMDFNGGSLIEALKSLPIEMDIPAIAGITAMKTGLVPIAATDYVRRMCEAEYAGTKVEIAIDRGVLSRNVYSKSFAEIEVELIEGDPETVRALTEQIREKLSLRYEMRGKLSRAMHLRGNHPHTNSY